jgi:hypothetical protein
VTRILAVRGIHMPRPFIISLRNTFRQARTVDPDSLHIDHGRGDLYRRVQRAYQLRDYITRSAVISVPMSRSILTAVSHAKIEQAGDARSKVWWVWKAGSSLAVNCWMPNGDVLENINVFGPPADSVLVDPLLVAGRWIRADDVRKLALSEAAYGIYPASSPVIQ